MNVSLCDCMIVCVWKCNTSSNPVLFDVPPQHPLPDFRVCNMVEKRWKTHHCWHYCFSVKELLRQNHSEVQNHIYVQNIIIFSNRTHLSEKWKCSRILHTSQTSRNFQESYTLLGESAKSENERFGMNVIVTASKLSKAE